MKFKTFYEQVLPESMDFFHSTHSKNLDSIINNGLRTSKAGTNKYGDGIYGTATLEDQSSKLQAGNYGDAIIKATVPDGNFIHVSPTAEPLDKQMAKFADPEKYPDFFEYLAQPTSKKGYDMKAKMISAYISQKYPEIREKIDGMVVNNLGTTTIVYYHPDKIQLDAVTTDGGESWKEIGS